MGRRTAMLRIAASDQKPPGGRRVGVAEVERRRSRVEELLGQGAARSAIVKDLGLPPRTIDAYIRRVHEKWRQDPPDEPQNVRAAARGRLMELRARLYEERAWPPLVRVEKLICELEGAFEPPVSADQVSRTGASALPPLPIEMLGERAPLLLTAAVRVAIESGDQSVLALVRSALERCLILVDGVSSSVAIEAS